MMSINVTLLLSLSMALPPTKEKKGKGKKQKNVAKDKPKKGGKQKAKRKAGIAVQEPPKPRNLFEIRTAPKSVHIEYELVPGKPPYKLDVKCWGQFAKVSEHTHFDKFK